MRYAVYFTPPPDDPLTMLAGAWVGRDAFTDKRLRHPDVPGITVEELSELAAFPRRYGFHATLKAPFHLNASSSEDAIVTKFRDFCRALTPFVVPKLVVARLGSFVALVPETPVPEVTKLAAEAVRAFEPMRAPLSEAESARRCPERLTDSQRANLEQWGYPYVFDDFRFHMTLTGPLAEERVDNVIAVLRSYLAPVLRRPVIVGSLGLYVQERPDRDFIVHTYCPLLSENLVTA